MNKMQTVDVLRTQGVMAKDMVLFHKSLQEMKDLLRKLKRYTHIFVLSLVPDLNRFFQLGT